MDEYVQAVRELGRAAIDHGISAIDQAQSAISDAISMIEQAMDDCGMVRKPESTQRYQP